MITRLVLEGRGTLGLVLRYFIAGDGRVSMIQFES